MYSKKASVIFSAVIFLFVAFVSIQSIYAQSLINSEKYLCDAEFVMEETLSNPQLDSMDVSMVPKEDIDIYIEYGKKSGKYLGTTPVKTVMAGERVTFKLDRLNPGKRYFYRTNCKDVNETDFGVREEYTFRTLRDRDDTGKVTFVAMADSHYYGLYSRGNRNGVCVPGGVPNQRAIDGMDLHKQTLANIKTFSPKTEFFVMGGDEAMTHCSGCNRCNVNGEDAGDTSVETAREAELRYELILGESVYGAITDSAPMIYKLGNHDGETSFGDPNSPLDQCDHSDTVTSLSHNARMKYLPNPNEVFIGNSDGDYYTFASGDVQIIVLNIMGGPDDIPQTVDDWTLGAQQLAWFEEVLKTSDRTWKFVFMEHMDGGVTDPNSSVSCYYYGRSSLKATENGEVNGTFLGEQATLHKLMKEYSGQFFFLSHDHVAVIGEKKDSNGNGEGVYYISGGKSSGVGAPWSKLNWFMEVMDYDNNGLADYNEDIWGVTDSGYYEITADSNRVDIKYIVSDLSGSSNGMVALDYTFMPNGTNNLPVY